MEAMPTPDFAVPYAAPMPAQHSGTRVLVSNKRGEDNHDLFPPGRANSLQASSCVPVLPLIACLMMVRRGRFCDAAYMRRPGLMLHQ
jgi:hypothetical protein